MHPKGINDNILGTKLICDFQRLSTRNPTENRIGTSRRRVVGEFSNYVFKDTSFVEHVTFGVKKVTYRKLEIQLGRDVDVTAPKICLQTFLLTNLICRIVGNWSRFFGERLSFLCGWCLWMQWYLLLVVCLWLSFLY